MIDNPVFIVGTERSGSNLLRLLLNELPDIAVPHPPHLMRDLAPLLPRYGDLQHDGNFRRLIADAARLVDLHYAPWPIRVDIDELLRTAPARDLYSVYAGIYEQFRRDKRKARWACKSTFMVHHIEDIVAHHPRPQFIHLVRDPRDVAVSARQSIFSNFHPFLVAELWRREQALALHAARRLSSDAWLTLRYEDLTSDPKASMRKVCKFLDQPFRASLLGFFEKPAAQDLAKLSRSWENLRRPVMADNTRKFKTALSAQAVGWIESVAALEMKELGYALEHKNWRTPSALQRTGFEIQERLWRWREESKALLLDRNARRRLRKNVFLWRLALRG